MSKCDTFLQEPLWRAASGFHQVNLCYYWINLSNLFQSLPRYQKLKYKYILVFSDEQDVSPCDATDWIHKI